jgi:hypothetical protein
MAFCEFVFFCFFVFLTNRAPQARSRAGEASTDLKKMDATTIRARDRRAAGFLMIREFAFAGLANDAARPVNSSPL